MLRSDRAFISARDFLEWHRFWAFCSCVKALQGLGELDVSMVLWRQGFSEVQWFDDLDEGASPNKTEVERNWWIARIRQRQD